MRIALSFLLALLTACGASPATETPKGDDRGPGKFDEGRAGWSADDSYEVAAVVTSTVVHEASGDYADLADDVALQQELAELQIKYIRNTVKASPHDYTLDQLARAIVIDQVEVDGHRVTFGYRAEVDLVRNGNPDALPALEDLEPRVFQPVVPKDPVNVYRDDSYQDRLGDACADDYGDYSLSEYKYYYYFAPEKPGCRERMESLGLYQQATLEIVEIYSVQAVYPEYDRLANELDDQGTIGFAAAVLPNYGDDDPQGRFKAHKNALEAMGLSGTAEEAGRYWRYLFDEEGVRMTIDLYDPTALSWPETFSSNFHRALGQYQYVQYNGHSNYGNTDLLANREAYADAYQIITMHSCSSYVFYADQVFRAKASDDPEATEDERRGWAQADVLATGESSYPSDSPMVMRVMLEGLMYGLVSIKRGTPDEAPSWQSLTREMNQSTWGYIRYGVSGSRTNRWRPE